MVNTQFTNNHKSAAKSNFSDPLAEEFARHTQAWLDEHGFVGHLVLTGAHAPRYKAMVDEAREHRQRVAGGQSIEDAARAFCGSNFVIEKASGGTRVPA